MCMAADITCTFHSRKTTVDVFNFVVTPNSHKDLSTNDGNGPYVAKFNYSNTGTYQL